LIRDRRLVPAQWRDWSWVITGIVILGIAVHGARDHWGLTHICLQALTMLGLALIAGRWPSLGGIWRVLVVVGAFIDLSLGIVLNFAIQSFAVDRWLSPTATLAERMSAYSESTVMNLVGKIRNHLEFVSDVAGITPAWIGSFLAVTLVLAIAQAHRARI
jgi:hypothetical protein